jgi:hypothetical protein
MRFFNSEVVAFAILESALDFSVYWDLYDNMHVVVGDDI